MVIRIIRITTLNVSALVKETESGPVALQRLEIVCVYRLLAQEIKPEILILANVDARIFRAPMVAQFKRARMTLAIASARAALMTKVSVLRVAMEVR